MAERNRVFAEYIPRHCQALARASQEMARRFGRGGRLLAVGMGPMRPTRPTSRSSSSIR